MTGRGRTCDAPRFRRALYRAELRSPEWARLGSNQQPLVCKTSALPLELLARISDPGQGVEPRSPRSERGVLPVRRSRNTPARAGPAEAAPPSISRVTGDRRSRRAQLSAAVASSVTSGQAERCCLCHSPTLRPWITDHWLRMCAVVAVLRGGALEPEPHALLLKTAG